MSVDGGKVRWRISGEGHTWTSSVERDVFTAVIEFDPETNVYTLTISEDEEDDIVTEHGTLRIAKNAFRKFLLDKSSLE